MSKLDDEEVLKALSLEEKALDEFKRRKNSLPQSQSSTKRSYEGKIEIIVKFNKFYKVAKFLQIRIQEKDRNRELQPLERSWI